MKPTLRGRPCPKHQAKPAIVKIRWEMAALEHQMSAGHKNTIFTLSWLGGKKQNWLETSKSISQRMGRDRGERSLISSPWNGCTISHLWNVLICLGWSPISVSLQSIKISTKSRMCLQKNESPDMVEDRKHLDSIQSALRQQWIVVIYLCSIL